MSWRCMFCGYYNTGQKRVCARCGMWNSRRRERVLASSTLSLRNFASLVSGARYQNTKECENDMNKAALDAHFLGLVEATEFIDRRSEAPIINDTVEAEDVATQTDGHRRV